MRRALRAGITAAVVLALTAPAARAVDQAAIDKAVERGVAFLKSAAPAGNETAQPAGATALRGLTLLECGAAPDDKAVQAVAAVVRQSAPTQNLTYSVALELLFLDCLGDPADVPLIESLAVRLLAGQNASGGWSYPCPAPPDSEVRRLTSLPKPSADSADRRDSPRPADKDGKPVKRTVNDLPKEIQQQLLLVNALTQPPGIGNFGDNSNTQFATVALWAARRHGLPVDRALGRIEQRYRVSQNPDGGWSYQPAVGAASPAPEPSTATMTCAGLLGLVVAQGARADLNQDAGKAAPDLAKDRALRAALALLGTAVGRPAGGARPVPAVGGKTFYFFWSLERVAVALDLDTVGGKDWYGWGSEILLANQAADGSWNGDFSPGVDTCFALLFLKRANLTRDLTSALRGKMKDPGAVTLKSGGVGGDALKDALKSGLEAKDAGSSPAPAEARLPTAPAAEETEGARLARELAQAPADRRDRMLEQYRDGKGVTYTEALAGAIPQLADDARRQAREALADRLTRMKPETLARYFQDQDAEIRRAAALAAAQRGAEALIPDLIPLLNDAEPSVARAAHAALKDLTGETLGPSADEWKAWWDKRERK